MQNLRESVQNILDEALKGIETSNYELEFRTKSNESRYLLVNATTRRNADQSIGTSLFFICFCYEIVQCSNLIFLRKKLELLE